MLILFIIGVFIAFALGYATCALIVISKESDKRTEELLLKKTDRLLVAIKRIKKEVSAKTGVSIKELESPRREQYIVRARNIAMKKCRESGATLEMIGTAFNRTHATVIHSIAQKGG